MVRSLRKVLLFGFLGALGCFWGWVVGEIFLLVAMPSSAKAGASLASRPVLPKLTAPVDAPVPPAPPELVASGSPTLRVQPAPPPPAIVATSTNQPAPPPPAEFAQRLEKAGAKSGDVQVTLIWFNVNDLDLHCVEPSGVEIFYARRTSPSGGMLDVDMNAGFGRTDRPVENIFWPKGRAPLGKYKVYVNHYSNNGGRDPSEYKVSILVGSDRKEYSGTISRFQPKRLIAEFDVSPASFKPADTPALRLAVSPQLILQQGGKNQLKLRVSREKITGPVQVRFEGNLAGITAPPLTIGADETEASAEIACDGSVLPGDRVLTAQATCDNRQADATFRLVVQPTPPELRVAVSPALVVNPGGNNRLAFRVARVNVPGPIQLRLDGDLRGIGPREFTLNPGENELSAELQAHAAAQPGQRIVNVIATSGAIRAETTFQLLVNAIPPQLRLAVPNELQINAGGQNQLPIRIARDRLSGPVEVQLTGDVDGLSPTSFTIPADREEEEITLTLGGTAPGTRDILVNARCGATRAEKNLQMTVVGPVGPEGPRWSWWMIVVIGLWTAVLTLGLSLALVMGQNWYLARPLVSLGELAVVLGGSLLAGIVAGGIGQTLYGLLTMARLVPEIGFLLGWLLLGGLLGRGLVFFIPNMSAWRAVAAGCAGGLFGAIAFIVVSFIGDIAGRFMGAVILGLALGLMVAIVESAFRKLWLEVVDANGKVRVVNLGATPVFLGGDARWCAVLIDGAPGRALKFWEEEGQVYCLDVLAEKTTPVAPGYRHRLKSSDVVVCSNERGSKPSAAPRQAAAPAAAAPVVKKPKADPPAPKAAPAAPAPKAVVPKATAAPPPKLVQPPPPPPKPAASVPPAPPPPPKQAPAEPVTAPCPVCGNLVTGVVWERRCTSCWTMF